MLNKLEPKQFSLSLDSTSPRTIEEHLKLYQGYITKHNEIVEKIDLLTSDDYVKANQTFSNIRELKIELSFAYSGVINHELYFDNLTNEITKPKDKLMNQIVKDFGDFDNFIKDLKASGMAARGWVYFCWDDNAKRLFNFIGDAHNSYLVFNLKPLFALDVYEHAYFIDFGSSRAKYLDEIIKNINWDKINQQHPLD
jgi:Fe-Mn family superoxide dismutase